MHWYSGCGCDWICLYLCDDSSPKGGSSSGSSRDEGRRAGSQLCIGSLPCSNSSGNSRSGDRECSRCRSNSDRLTDTSVSGASSSGSAGGNRYGGSGSSSSSSSSSSGSDVVGEVMKSVALISLTSESDSTTAPVTIHSTARTRTGVSDSSTAGPGLDPGQIQRGVHPRKGAEKGVEREREREREGGDDEDKSSSSSTSEVTSQTLSEEFHARGYALRKTGK